MRHFIILVIIPLIFGCNNNSSTSPENNTSSDTLQQKTIVPNEDSVLLDLTKQVLISIKEKDYKKFAEFIHPTLGIRFSPSSYIDTIQDVKLSTQEFLDKVDKQDKIKWGNYDGSGEEIKLAVKEYFEKFVYNADFLNAEKISVNKIIKSGNKINNVSEVYKDCDFTESHFSGFDKKFEGMDWCSLRLVFKNYQDKFYLVGIVNDRWTI